MRVVLLLVCLLASLGSRAAFAQTLCAMSDAFRVYSYKDGPAPQAVLQECHKLRSRLHRKWCGMRDTPRWYPPCEVVLHGQRKEYIRAVGEAGRLTLGSTLINFRQGQITRRRLDLLVDAQGRIPALSHELTHVVLADRFPSGKIPPWFDEGAALLADSPEKQAMHRADYDTEARAGRALQLDQLMARDLSLTAEQVPVFYGQSLAVVEFLLQRGPPETLTRFVELSLVHDCDHAVRTCYAFDDLAELEHAWQQHADGARRMPTRSMYSSR